MREKQDPKEAFASMSKRLRKDPREVKAFVLALLFKDEPLEECLHNRHGSFKDMIDISFNALAGLVQIQASVLPDEAKQTVERAKERLDWCLLNPKPLGIRNMKKPLPD